MCKLKPTAKQYTSLQDAYSFFNKELFNDELPPVFITFQRQKKSHGYYWHEKLESRADETLISEIALNLAGFGLRQDKEILSTLVHEMVHHWQYCLGEPTRNGYHNKQWGSKMKEIGLFPSSTAQEGGKETGQSVSHYVINGGVFDSTCDTLLATGAVFDWNSNEAKKDKKASKANKVKYTCPDCDSNAWGKPELNITCSDCDMKMLSTIQGGN